MKKYRVLSFLMTLSLLFTLLLPGFAEDETSSESFQETEESFTGFDINPEATAPVIDTDPVQTPDGVTPAPTGFEIPSPLAEYNYPVEMEYIMAVKGAALIELNTRTIVYSRELDTQIYPASLTKIMTCMIALENGNLDDVLTVSPEALSGLSAYGSTAGLLEGEQLTLRELLYCVMVSSANEACNVVAEYIAGDKAGFVALMNQKAQELGMTATHFANTHGLHDDEHYTTVRDLATLATWAWQNPQFREFATTVEHVIPATNKSEARTLHTTNYLTVPDEDNKYYYEKALGVKTGFTTPAGGCLISTATDGELSFMSIVVGCSSVINGDGSETDQRFFQTEDLLEFGFETFQFVQVFSKNAMLGQPAVRNAAGRANVVVHPKENASVLLPKTYDPELITMELSYDDASLKAPLAEGAKVGTVTAKYANILLATTDLVTLTAVDEVQAVTLQPQEETGFLTTLLDAWYLTVPMAILLVLIVLVFILRSANARRARKRAQRRRAAQRRRRE